MCVMYIASLHVDSCREFIPIHKMLLQCIGCALKLKTLIRRDEITVYNVIFSALYIT